METVTEVFGSNVFDDRVMKANLSAKVYQSLKKTIDESYAICDTVLGKMSALRVAVDEAETLTAEKCWPFPSYCDLLFGVR